MEVRGISKTIVEQTLENPLQTKEEDGINIYQSIVDDYLFRIFVNETKDPKLIIIVYKTSKIKNTMKVKYDKEVDVLYIEFSDNKITESDEEKSGIILDNDSEGSIVCIEVLNASKKIKNINKVEYEVA